MGVKRDPELHVKLSSLKEVIKTLGIVSNAESDADKIAMQILKASYKKQLKDRYVIQARTQGIKKKLEKTVQASNAVTDQFNMILTYTRRNIGGHKYVKDIRKNDKDYLLLKEVAQIAMDFTEMYNFHPITEGFKTFCRVGLRLMGRSYSLSRFKYYSNDISHIYECNLVVSEDADKEGTKDLYDCYLGFLLQYAQIEVAYKEDFTKYAHFVKAREEADEYGADYSNWIEAQFEGLDFLGAIPEPNQLYSNKAGDRYVKFVVDKNKLTKKDRENQKFLETVKNSEDKEYFKKLQDYNKKRGK